MILSSEISVIFPCSLESLSNIPTARVTALCGVKVIPGSSRNRAPMFVSTKYRTVRTWPNTSILGPLTNNARCYCIDLDLFVLESSCEPPDHTYNAVLGCGIDGSKALGVKAGVGRGAYNASLE